MKNKERYAKEIIEMACSGNSIAVDKQSKKLVSCNSIPCRKCLFYISDDGCCDNNGKREWAEQEYIEKPVISKRDKAFLEYIGEEYKFVARDENGGLFAYKTQPRKMEVRWTWVCDNYLKLYPNFNIDFQMGR